MTYSIAARDPETGEMGVAVQSHYFSTGSVVPWGEAGVGVVATQSMVEASYGPFGLDRMRDGADAPAALAALVELDEGREQRQVAMIDAAGRADAFTGSRCIAEAGHIVGDGFTVQANMMRRDTVPATMADAYVSATGPFGDRLLAALDAAEAEGGDIRGRQSAALVVVKPELADHPYAGIILDVRVDDHAEPLVELRRLVELQRAYRSGGEGFEEHPEFAFWRGVTLGSQGEIDAARAAIAPAFADSGGEWRELLRRLPAAGLCSQEVVDRLLG